MIFTTKDWMVYWKKKKGDGFTQLMAFHPPYSSFPPNNSLIFLFVVQNLMATNTFYAEYSTAIIWGKIIYIIMVFGLHIGWLKNRDSISGSRLFSGKGLILRDFQRDVLKTVSRCDIKLRRCIYIYLYIYIIYI